MGRQILIFSPVVLVLAVACGANGIRIRGDGSADGRSVDATIADRGSLVRADIGLGSGGSDGFGESGLGRPDGIGGSSGPDGIGGVGGPDSSGNFPMVDAGVPPPDAPIGSPDGNISLRFDAVAQDQRPSETETGADTGWDGGTPPETLPSPIDAGIVSFPDAEVDSASDAVTPPSIDAASVSTCHVPRCWADLMQDCQPAGACLEQSAETKDSLCFANGVATISVVDEAAGKMTTTVKIGTRICYELDWDLTSGSMSGAASTGLIKNASGAVVATISDNASGYSAITCTNAEPVVVAEWCDLVGNVRCDPGVCNP